MKNTHEMHGWATARRAEIYTLVCIAVLSGILVFPGSSPAISLSGESSTYLQSKQAADGTKQLPIYEYLNLAVRDVGKETISFQFGGWLRYDLKSEGSENSRSANDLSYAYLSYRDASANTTINVGRVMVFEGVATERVDGVYARTDLVHNLGVSAYGGTPAETGNTLTQNGSIYGARLSHQMPGLYQIGLSYLKEDKESATFRKEEGIDLWVRPLDKVELMGKSRYNGVTSAWSDHNYLLVLGPFSGVRLNTEMSLIKYKDYFTGATTAVFKFDPSAVDKDEKARVLGEEIVYDANDKLSISANYRTYTYDLAGSAKNIGAGVRYRVDKTGGEGIAIHKMSGDTDRLNYTEYRIYGYRKYGHTDVTVDLLNVKYGEEINGVKNAYSLTLAAAYELTERMKLGADLEYSKNPDFSKDLRTFFKLMYSFDSEYGKKGGV